MLSCLGFAQAHLKILVLLPRLYYKSLEIFLIVLYCLQFHLEIVDILYITILLVFLS